MNCTRMTAVTAIALKLDPEQRRELKAVLYGRDYESSPVALESLRGFGLIALDDGTAVSTEDGRYAGAIIMRIN